jgi:hypothetical protein
LDFFSKQCKITDMGSKYSGPAVFITAVIGVVGFVGGISLFFDSVCLFSCTSPQSPAVGNAFALTAFSFMLLVVTCIPAITLIRRGDNGWALGGVLVAGLPVIFGAIFVTWVVLSSA